MTAKLLLCGVDKNGAERPVLVDKQGALILKGLNITPPGPGPVEPILPPANLNIPPEYYEGKHFIVFDGAQSPSLVVLETSQSTEVTGDFMLDGTYGFYIDRNDLEYSIYLPIPDWTLMDTVPVEEDGFILSFQDGMPDLLASTVPVYYNGEYLGGGYGDVRNTN